MNIKKIINAEVFVDISFNPNQKLQVVAKLYNHSWHKYNKETGDMEEKIAHQSMVQFDVDNMNELRNEDLSQFEKVSIQNI